MIAPGARPGRFFPATPALAATVLLAAATLVPPAVAQSPAPPAPKRNIGGPGDFALREKIVHGLSRDPDLSKENFSVILVNGGVVYSGPVKNCALKRRALMLAATTRGVINVTDEMTVPRGDVADPELAKAVTSLLSDAAASLGLKALDVRVADGVLTLDGTVDSVVSRGHAEEIVGTVLGVTRISNHLRPANAPTAHDDASLLKSELDYLGDFHNYSFPGNITVKVEQGVVTLKGKTSMFMGRQQAALVASLVIGATRVDNRIQIDPGIPPRAGHVRAEE